MHFGDLSGGRALRCWSVVYEDGLGVGLFTTENVFQVVSHPDGVSPIQV